MEVYVASCFTGAQCQGVYSTLEAAQQAITDHYALLTNHDTNVHVMFWKRLHDSWAWLPKEHYTADMGNPWAFNNTPDGLMENVTITVYTMDDVLPVV